GFFLSPIPFTFFKSSALRNGRAAMIREGITGPTPGIIFNSFSVAVLMSILPGWIFSFACEFLRSAGLTVVAEERNACVAELRENEFTQGDAWERAIFSATKTLKGAGFWPW